MIADGKIDGLIEKLVAPVGRIAVVDLSGRSSNDLSGKRPIPAFSFVSEPQTGHMQICVRHDRIEISVARGVLTKKVPCAYPISV